MRAFLRTLRPATAWAVIRTMLIGWTTTCRMHGPPPPPASGARPLGEREERLRLMGCPVAHDATVHYLECPIPRGAVCDCLPRLLPPGLAPGALPLTAATRTVPVATCLHIITHVYHAVRFEHGAAVRRAGPAARHRLLRTLVRAAAAHVEAVCDHRACIATVTQSAFMVAERGP